MLSGIRSVVFGARLSGAGDCASERSINTDK